MNPPVATSHHKCAICGLEINRDVGCKKIGQNDLPFYVAFTRRCLKLNSVICRHHLDVINGHTVPIEAVDAVVPFSARRGQRSARLHHTRHGGPSTRGDYLWDRTDPPTEEELNATCVILCDLICSIVREGPPPLPPLLPPPPARPVIPDFISQNPSRWIGLPSLSDLDTLVRECKMEDATVYTAPVRLAATLAYLVSGCNMSQIGDFFHISQQRVSEFCAEGREKLHSLVVPQWLRAETLDELKDNMPADFREKYKEFAAIVDGTLIYVCNTVVPSLRSVEFSWYKSAQAIKLLVIVSFTGWIIDVVGPFSPEKSDDSLCLIDQINRDTPFRRYLTDTCCKTDPHRHGILADLGFTDAENTLRILDPLGPANRFQLECEHKLFIRLPSLLADRPRLPAAEATDSQFVTTARQLVERANRRIKECRLFSSDLPIHLSPQQIVEWARIAACLGNRYKGAMTP